MEMKSKLKGTKDSYRSPPTPDPEWKSFLWGFSSVEATM
jgi:hypothetical protein